MLLLYTSGSRYSRRRCESVVEFFVHKYLKRYKIEVEVLHRGLKREGVLGYCDINGETYRPRSFLIEIQSGLKKEDYLIVLFHELWHLYQFVKGDLKVKASKSYYKGQCIEGIPYEDLEHEKEAYSMESKLLHEYITSMTP